jgi:hypothetical protein
MCYFHTKFEINPIKITRKIRFLSVLWLGQFLTLTFDHDPYHLVWWLLTPWHFYMLTMMFLRRKTKKLDNFSFYIMTSPNDVITSTFLLIWKALNKTFDMRYYTIWYRMVPLISKFDLGVSKFRPAAQPMKVRADQPQKSISWVAAHILFSHQVWRWSDKSYSKNKGFIDNLLLPWYDLYLRRWP